MNPPALAQRLGRLGLWLLAAALLLAPTSLSPRTFLLGDPRVDVWNHAWGYWWVADALSQGVLPYQTSLIGAPGGGLLYFIDSPGALLWSPVTLLAGPALAYNLALLCRVALAGYGAQRLAEVLLGPGPHAWVAGLAYATSPFLLGELHNGISEVVALHWIPFALAALLTLQRQGRPKDGLRLGLYGGLCGVATFYYGLAAAIVIGPGLLAFLLRRRRAALLPTLLALLVAAALILPVWNLFTASISSPDALISRPAALNEVLAAHNAVDPRALWTPGAFSSVDFEEQYGEAFVHSSYLRLSLLALALVGLFAKARLRPLLLPTLLSLTCSLGAWLWWGGDWVRHDGAPLRLPFGHLLDLLPAVAITHPARLQVGALALLAALAAAGVQSLGARFGRPAAWSALAGLLLVSEGLFGSAAPWPIARSSATIPTYYAQTPTGFVLDLPVDVDATMMSSWAFWAQTVHHRPIPWTPDVRLRGARDPNLRWGLGHPEGDWEVEYPQPISDDFARHLSYNYGMIVLHRAREANRDQSWAPYLQARFGRPQERDGALVWTLAPGAP